MSVPNPSVPPSSWRYAGDQLKRWRVKAGVTREQLGEAARYSPDTIKAMEQGVRMPTAQVLDVADALFRAEGMLSAAKEYLSRDKFPARAVDFMAQEREAQSLWSYEVALIPGLLQTEAYARAVFTDHWPPVDDATIERRTAARLERQEILTQEPLVAFSFVIFEAALRCPLGGKAVFREQLLHLLDVATLRNVSIQVLPFERAPAVAAIGPMVLLESKEHDRFAYSTGQSMSQLTVDPDVVSSHAGRLSMIRAEALNAEESAVFIQRMVDRYAP